MIDFSQPPYATYLSRLSTIHDQPAAWESLACHMVKDAEKGAYDANGEERERLAWLLYLELESPSQAFVRFLLEAEIEARQKSDFQGAGDCLILLSLLLVEGGKPADIPRFFKAKFANFDTQAGGYDIEFIFSILPHDDTLDYLKTCCSAEDLERLDAYDTEEVSEGILAWRLRLQKWYPREISKHSTAACEQIAELFGDRKGMELFGLKGAKTAEDRARFYRRFEKYDAAFHAWQEASQEVTDPWDRISRLTSAIEDAAKAGLPALKEAQEIDALHGQISAWNEVGLGRHAAKACYQSALVSTDRIEGQHLWKLAEKWRRKFINGLSLVGLRVAIKAAQKWGESADIEELIGAARIEHQSIYGDEKTFTL